MKWAKLVTGLLKRGLTRIGKFFKIILCKQKKYSQYLRSKYGKAKDSGSEKKAESGRHGTGADGTASPNAGGFHKPQTAGRKISFLSAKRRKSDAAAGGRKGPQRRN